MRVGRGCGCPILILVVVDLAFLIGAIINLIRGPSGEPVSATRLGAGLTLVVFAANLIVCAIMAIAAFRGQALGPTAGETPSLDDSSGEGEETDSGQDDQGI
jgi:hypothetical protein